MNDDIFQYGSLFVTQWLDVIWVFLAPALVHKGQRLKAVAFMIVCMLTLRLQVGIVESTGFQNGFTGLIDMALMTRGFIVYGIFSALYLLLSYLSPSTRGAIYLAASLSIFFMAFTVSSVVLIV